MLVKGPLKNRGSSWSTLRQQKHAIPDSVVHGANMGPTWAPCWPHEPCYQGCVFAEHTSVLDNRLNYHRRNRCVIFVYHFYCRRVAISSEVSLGYIVWRHVITENVFGIVNTLGPGHNGCHFTDDIFKCIFLNGKYCIPDQMSLKFAPKNPTNSKSALVQVIACTEEATSHYLNQN